jgi:fructoselysine-6-P-deglycase FrlB-like protein
MIRGIHKQIVVLQELENSMFEQAIFILKPNALKGYKKNPDEVIKEARKVVDHYAQRNGVIKTKGKIKSPAIILKRRRRLIVFSLCFFSLMVFAWLCAYYML